MDVSDLHQLTQEEEKEVWLWHHGMSHQNSSAIDNIRRGDMVLGIPNFHYLSSVQELCD